MTETNGTTDPVPDPIRSPVCDCLRHLPQEEFVGGPAIEVVKASDSTHQVMILALPASNEVVTSGNRVHFGKSDRWYGPAMTSAGRFQVCDFVIESSVPLPELRETVGGSPLCRFKVLPAGKGFAGEFHWFHRWPAPDGGVWLSFARNEDYLLRFPGQGDFLISRDGREVQCRPLRGTPESTIRHLFLDQVIPLVLSRRELLVLHASAILTPDGVIAFVGKSGHGKSTLAASFGQVGYPLISDDYLLLRKTAEDWIAIPSYPGVRLWPRTSEGIFSDPPETTEVAHYTEKRRVFDPAIIPFAERPSSLRCMYFLDDDGDTSPEPAIAHLSPKDIFMKLVTAAFNLDILDKVMLARQFCAIGDLGTRLPCFGLRYARDFSVLPAVRRLVMTQQMRSAV